MFSETGNAIEKVADNLAVQLGSFGWAMPIVLVLSVGLLGMAFYAMLMVTSLINSAME